MQFDSSNSTAAVYTKLYIQVETQYDTWLQSTFWGQDGYTEHSLELMRKKGIWQTYRFRGNQIWTCQPVLW